MYKRQTLPVVARLLGVDAAASSGNTQRLLFTPTGAGKSDVVEVTIPPHSPVVGRRIVELGFPADVLIMVIHRGTEYIVPNGSTTLAAGDELQMLGSRESFDALRERIEARHTA